VLNHPPASVIYLSEMCLPLYSPLLQFPPSQRTVRDLGPARLGNRQVAHLRVSETGGTTTDREDIYFDTATRYWLRVVFHQHDADSRTSAGWTFNYSGFNRPTHIEPPIKN